MTRQELEQLLTNDAFITACGEQPELIETHISWVILCKNLVYKIKQPIRYSFLDCSSVAQRKYYCEKEVELNRRLTEAIYLDVQPVYKFAERIGIGSATGAVIDYAVRMNRIDRQRQMDVLLRNNAVTPDMIKALAIKMAAFHQNTTIVREKNLSALRKDFNDLSSQYDFVSRELSPYAGEMIMRAVHFSDVFIDIHTALLKDRLQQGFYRDGHGDLHTRNVFFLPEPQPFDCIEFNDDYRQIDVLNEVAFMCMDLDAFGRQDLSELFINTYNAHFRAIRSKADEDLFTYYKSYRANVRAKVNSLRALSAGSTADKKKFLEETERYLKLMQACQEHIQSLASVTQ
jgi:aminoglycoside phosphotransferase family enzyme